MLFKKLATLKENKEGNERMAMMEQPKGYSLQRRKTNNNKGKRNNGNK